MTQNENILRFLKKGKRINPLQALKEEWKDIPGYKGRYQASSHGQIKSLSRLIPCIHNAKRRIRERILSQHIMNANYYTAHICYDMNNKTMLVHRLVAMAFLSNPENKPEVNHKNGIRLDNRVENLEWVTSKENTAHARGSGLFDNSGEKHYLSKLTIKNVNSIRRNKNLTHKQLGEKYGVNRRTITDVLLLKTWNTG